MNAILDVLNSVGFDWRVAIANLVNFLIVFYLLNRFIFSKIRVTLGERKKVIEGGLEEATKAKTTLMMAGEKEKEIVNTARAEANKIIADANHKGNELIKKGEERGLKEEQALIGKAKVEIEKNKIKAGEEFESEAVDLVLHGVEKVLKSKMNDKMNEDLIRQMFKEAKT